MLAHRHLGEEAAKFQRRAMHVRQPNSDRRHQYRDHGTVPHRRRGDILLYRFVCGRVDGPGPDGADVHEGVLLAECRQRDLRLALHAGVYGGEASGRRRRSATRDVDEVEGLVLASESPEGLRGGQRVVLRNLDIFPIRDLVHCEICRQ